MNIGLRIRERRKELKISVDELAAKLGKDRSTIYRYEKGDIENLPLDILEPIATALETTPAYLMGWEREQKNNATIADISEKNMEHTKIDTTSNRLKIAMKEIGKKQVDLSNETGIDKGSISHYVSGKYIPKQDTIYKLARALNVSEMWLWGYDCPKERPIEQKNNDAIADIIVKLRTDEEFFYAVKKMSDLDKENFEVVSHMLDALSKQSIN